MYNTYKYGHLYQIYQIYHFKVVKMSMVSIRYIGIDESQMISQQ